MPFFIFIILIIYVKAMYGKVKSEAFTSRITNNSNAMHINNFQQIDQSINNQPMTYNNPEHIKQHKADVKYLRDLIDDMEDRENDWYAKQIRSERIAKREMDAMFRLKIEHTQNHGKY